MIYSFNFSKDYILDNEVFNFSTSFCTNWCKFSTLLTSELGVPQGSILGPIFFNLCVPEMLQITRESKCRQYADDATLYQCYKSSQWHTCISSI